MACSCWHNGQILSFTIRLFASIGLNITCIKIGRDMVCACSIQNVLMNKNRPVVRCNYYNRSFNVRSVFCLKIHSCYFHFGLLVWSQWKSPQIYHRINSIRINLLFMLLEVSLLLLHPFHVGFAISLIQFHWLG